LRERPALRAPGRLKQKGLTRGPTTCFAVSPPSLAPTGLGTCSPATRTGFILTGATKLPPGNLVRFEQSEGAPDRLLQTSLPDIFAACDVRSRLHEALRDSVSEKAERVRLVREHGASANGART